MSLTLIEYIIMYELMTRLGDWRGGLIYFFGALLWRPTFRLIRFTFKFLFPDWRELFRFKDVTKRDMVAIGITTTICLGMILPHFLGLKF